MTYELMHKQGAKTPEQKREVSEYIAAKLIPSLQRWATLDEAIEEAEIDRRTVFRYKKDFPSLDTKIKTAKNWLDKMAETNVHNSIMGGNVKDSKWRLERSKKDKYSTKTIRENPGETVPPKWFVDAMIKVRSAKRITQKDETIIEETIEEIEIIEK